ncbi:Transcriptional activator of proteases prtT [Exophiala dermatitidis]
MSQKRPYDDSGQSPGRRPPPPPPRVSRTKACMECRRHKIKCEVRTGESACTKCLKGGIECVFQDLTQKFQEEDALWKTQTKMEIGQMRAAIRHLLKHNQLPDLSTYHAASTVTSPANPGSAAALIVPPMDMTRENSQEPQSRDDAGLVPAPMSSLYDLTRLKTLRSSVLWRQNANMLDDDFISQGVISLEDAEYLFSRYLQNNNQLLWGGVLLPHPTLVSVRRSSTMLTAAVLTIAALHVPDRDELLQTCYSIFVSLVSNTCLSRHHTLDDVRALSLGAFYLSNLSWKLSGMAVRLAVEMNLHQSFQKRSRPQPNQHECVRLWYALYVCEHHFSIAYGRPPIIGDDMAVKNVEKFLESPEIVPGDVRLAAQVALFRILTEAYTEYGSDPEQPLGEQDFERLRVFNFAIEQWRLTWQARSADSVEVGSYPSKGVVLYYHFARFQLNSLALRAVAGPNSPIVEPLTYDRREAANIAISAATSTLTLILEENDLRRAMPGVPIFTHTMVAFCATFLLKMAMKWSSNTPVMMNTWSHDASNLGLNFSASQVIALIRRSADFLAEVSEKLNQKHLTRHIVAGIRYLLKSFDEETEASSRDGSLSYQHNNSQEPFIGNLNSTTNASDGLNGNYNFYDLVGSYGFGFDESYLGQVEAHDPDLWSYT